jgi:hypothetical protein
LRRRTQKFQAVFESRPVEEEPQFQLGDELGAYTETLALLDV